MSFSRTGHSEKETVQVAVRVRPINTREHDTDTITSIDGKNIYLKNPEDKKKKTFSFDYVYDSSTKQNAVFNDLGKQVIDHAYAGYNTCVFAYGQTGCFAPGTQVMLYNGTYKAIENVNLTDYLMGDDSTPRKVLHLFHGLEEMYHVSSLDRGFTDYIVNQSHVMVFLYKPSLEYVNHKWRVMWLDWSTTLNGSTVRDCTTTLNGDTVHNYYDHPEISINKFDTVEAATDFMHHLPSNIIFEMTIKEYLQLSSFHKKLYYCYTTDVELEYKETDVDPYNYGFWLGNRIHAITDTNLASFTNLDLSNIVSYVVNQIQHNNLLTRVRFISGFIESHGYVHDTKRTEKLYTMTIPYVLRESLMYICQSIGMVAYDNPTQNSNLVELIILMNNQEYQTFLPCITPLGIGEYYGFMLDGNHRFVGAGFNVLRNSGKSHTMMGTNEDHGLIPLICKTLFDQRINHNNKLLSSNVQINYKVELSYLEIYSEMVRDLLIKSPTNLKVREHPEFGPYVESLSQILVEDYDTIKQLIDQGNKERVVAATLMNQRSSRSHAILTLYFTQIIDDPEIGKTRQVVSKINLVDLAGSERIEISGVTGINCKEAIEINKSLSALGLVISTLAAQSIKRAASASKVQGKSVSSVTGKAVSSITGKAVSSVTGKAVSSIINKAAPIKSSIKSNSKSTSKVQSNAANKSTNKVTNKVQSKNTPIIESDIIDHIPFRDSVLTWILKESLGGNSCTYMIATVSPSSLNYSESLNTLRYASNAKQIVNTVKINEDPNDKLIRVLKDEIDTLKRQLRNKTQDSTSSTEDIRMLDDEIAQREELMREKDKSWEQKLTESKRISEEVQEQLKAELELAVVKHNQELKEMELLKNQEAERAAKLQEEMAKRQEEIIKKEAELLKHKKEFETDQMYSASTKLNNYYEERLNEAHNKLQEKLQLEYETKLTSQTNLLIKKYNEEIDQLHITIKKITDENTRLTNSNAQIHKQLTNDRVIHSKQMQSLHTRIKSLETELAQLHASSSNSTL